MAVSKVATVCQMVVYDQAKGPDGDGERKGLRRQWYHWYKVRFAQPFSRQLAEQGDEKESQGFDGTGWAGRMSQTYSYLVDQANVTYWDLWVDDASRMMESFWDTLFRGCHIVVAVEKDSLFRDFIPATRALGGKTVVSGKGKQSKAATEKMLREHFGWRHYDTVFTQDEPLVVLHISDHDFDGEKVIGPTFGDQARRYTDYILEARVGIKPGLVRDWEGSWYEVKTTNKGYVGWAESKGLFKFECAACGHVWLDQGHVGECPECWCEVVLTVKDSSGVVNQPHGFEVEALPTRAYYKLLVQALLEVLPFDYIIGKLRDECTADHYRAAETIREAACGQNESYKALLAEFDRLEKIKSQFESMVKNAMIDLGEDCIHLWRDLENDPTQEDFEEHVQSAGSYANPWRPFNKDARTRELVKHLRERHQELIKGFEQEKIEW